MYNKDSAEDEDNEQSSSSEQSRYSLETVRIMYGISWLSLDKFTGLQLNKTDMTKIASTMQKCNFKK